MSEPYSFISPLFPWSHNVEKLKKPIGIPVKFGNVNVGENTCRLPFSIQRTKLSNDEALDLLVCRQLTGTITTADPSQLGTNPQKMLFDKATARIEGVFNTGNLSVGRKKFGSGATFPLSEIDESKISKFANRTGIVWIDATAPIEDKEKKPVKVTVPEEKPAKAEKAAKPAKKLAVSKTPKPRSRKKK